MYANLIKFWLPTGLEHLFFCINPGDTNQNLKSVYLVINGIVQSVQGLAFSILYCFTNSEVSQIIHTRANPNLEMNLIDTSFFCAPILWIGSRCDRYSMDSAKVEQFHSATGGTRRKPTSTPVELCLSSPCSQHDHIDRVEFCASSCP